MNILITGGAGNIGSYLVQTLCAYNNANIVVVDNFLTGRFKNLHPVKNSIVLHDMDCNNPDFEQFILDTYDNFDIIVHLAAVVGVERTLEFPEKVLADFQGFMNIVNIAKQFKTCKVLFASSSEVYGEPVEHPQNEKTTPLNAQLPYAVTKLMGEKVFETYSKINNFTYCNMRLFNTYGPNQSLDFVVPKFVHCAKNNLPITIIGNGEQTRTFCYIQDTVDAIISLFDCNLNVINIGSHVEISMIELASIVKDVLKSKSEIIFLPERARGDMLRRCPENYAMLSKLGRELTPIALGIEKMVHDGA